MRFAVRRLGIPEASSRSHRPPGGDVSGCVHVGVDRQTAGDAAEERLTLATLRSSMPAARTGLRCEARIDPLDSSRSLVSQSTHQQTPPGGEDAVVQPGLLTNISARCFRGAFRRASHVFDLQVFDTDHVEIPGQAGRALLYPVLASVALAGPELCDRGLDAFAPLAALLRPCKLPLQPHQAFLLPARKSRHVKELAGRQGGRHSHAPVNADNLSGPRPTNRFRYHSEGHMPPACRIASHPERFHIDGHGSRPAERHPADLRDTHLPHIPRDTADIPGPPAPPDDLETLIPPSLPPRWPSMRSRVETGHGLVEIPQCLLLHCLRPRCQPSELRPCLGQLPGLLHVTRRARPARPPMLVLLDREIPHEPRMAAISQEGDLLGRCGLKTKP